jgi:hypothetical protein
VVLQLQQSNDPVAVFYLAGNVWRKLKEHLKDHTLRSTRGLTWPLTGDVSAEVICLGMVRFKIPYCNLL